MQFTAGGVGAQRGIRRGVPQEQREARGERPVVELAGGSSTNTKPGETSTPV